MDGAATCRLKSQTVILLIDVSWLSITATFLAYRYGVVKRAFKDHLLVCRGLEQNPNFWRIEHDRWIGMRLRHFGR